MGKVVTKLRQVRESKGLSRHRLSMMTDISIRNIESYEQGHVKLENAQYKTVKTLADALEVGVEDIIDSETSREA